MRYSLRTIIYTIITKTYLKFNGIKYGKNILFFGIPQIEKDKKSNIIFGDNVTIRKNVDLRARNGSTLHIADNCQLDTGVRVLVTNNSTYLMNAGVEIGAYTIANVGANVSIGQNTLIAGHCYLQTSNHGFKKNELIKNQTHDQKPITIGSDAWIGGGSFLLNGAYIADGVVIGANSIVNTITEADDIYAGSPIKKIGTRK